MKEAFSKVMRFMVCALVMYMGFLFCGWLVLGPYHIKFRHFSTAFECLFSLVNGDDMFGTFAATESEDIGLWFFSRIYLYSFISLFVFCVLSLFISLFTETYDTLQTYFKDGFPKTSLHRFLEQCEEEVENYPCKLCCDSFCERCQLDESEEEKIES
ncbi:hypothetical protein V1264_024079 [Littorina saxatilis]|uniref:Polycystin cation channel PKD1/PKD2 domain-containing protein n=2 Tax=Littorina saxatilis TaxID=31220 RepID=A0AAN9B9J1_9CAEN